MKLIIPLCPVCYNFRSVILPMGEPEPPAKWMLKGQPTPSIPNETPNLL